MDLFDVASRLAFFLHRDAELAHRIVLAALHKVGLASGRQERREYYRPLKRRSKAVLSQAQLLQFLIYLESEPHERQREKVGGASAEDLLVWSIKHLVQITLQRNAFHVAVGIAQLLYGYNTRETMTIFDALAQDSECRYGEDYYRARKSVLLREFRQRFRCHGPALDREPRREWQFQDRLIGRCLEMFTPWGTHCAPADRPEANLLPPMDAGDDKDREQYCLHALIHPQCFCATIHALDLDPPEERLEISPILPIVPLASAADGVRGDGEDVRSERSVVEVSHPPEAARGVPPPGVS